MFPLRQLAYRHVRASASSNILDGTTRRVEYHLASRPLTETEAEIVKEFGRIMEEEVIPGIINEKKEAAQRAAAVRLIPLF